MAEGEGRFVEYAGGYGDMVAQRGAGVTAKTAARQAAPAKAPKAEPRARRAQALLQDKHALETLPGRIGGSPPKSRRWRTSSPTGPSTPATPRAFTEASARLDAARAERDAAEHRWLELEMLREEMEA